MELGFSSSLIVKMVEPSRKTRLAGFKYPLIQINGFEAYNRHWFPASCLNWTSLWRGFHIHIDVSIGTYDNGGKPTEELALGHIWLSLTYTMVSHTNVTVCKKLILKIVKKETT